MPIDEAEFCERGLSPSSVRRGIRGREVGIGEDMDFPLEESAGETNVGKNGEGTTMVVGIKEDDGSRELLTWTLVNVAQAGDRVIALHVLPAEVPDSGGEYLALNSTVNALNAMIAAYEVFCNLKQIDLKLKISRGSSIRRALAQETSLASASKLIVGVSKCSNQGFSYFSVSVAKYCAKKLSGCCLVLAVNNGKIVFGEEAAGERSIDDLSLGTDSVRPCKINEQPKKDADLSRRSFHCLPSASSARLSSDRINSFASKLSWRFSLSKNEKFVANNSLDEPLYSAVFGELCHASSDSVEGPFNEILTKFHARPMGCLPSQILESSQRKPGWSLFRRTFSCHKNNSPQRRPKASAVQLAKHLPSWFPISAVVHPDHKQDKSDEVSKPDFNGVTPIPSFEFDDETKDLSRELLSLHEKHSSSFRLFSYKELEQATSNFSPENIIGKGGNSRVYKGCLLDKKELAVKVLEHSDDALKNFISEIKIMSNLKHKNIISLTGFCFENKKLVLVFDFLSRGSLEDNLHGNEGGKNSPGWAERYKIAVGVAEALHYLHESSAEQPVIHRDVKSSNILLSDDFEPQLSDFGLARLASTCMKNTTSSDLEGTFGYLAPECFAYGEIDEKVDVYAFGVVLLELLSGRKPVSTNGPKGEESLVLWAKPILRAWSLEQLLDPSLGENYKTDEMERMCFVASLCIREMPGDRPSIALVLKLIKGDDEAVKLAKLELGSSMLFDDMDDEATINNLNIQSHINLALLGIDDDVALSVSSLAHSFDFTTSNSSLEEYLRERLSHSLSFN
ncbi:probable leucine-rich repeat receptor-like protein kinase At5g05160 [Phalaenopsis equestris]|uniref:probable leucine-rich repeat receptor-like protein kinase At5g05160 n=1 Tax=Phalaenopsis equestris TaxID=78828 RepID=UPI0009E2FD2C|nr:probable leucine-rich repeat receptor-like protein kinase At5g05160 [Phalaenopsis equestris]